MKRYNPILHGTPKAWDDSRKLYGGGGGGGESTTVQEIPAELKPLASAYATKAMALGDQEYTPYQDQRYSDLNALQIGGVGMAANRALEGSYTVDNAEGNLNQMMTQGPNPYLDDMYNTAAEKVAGSVNSNFSQAGRYGSGAHTEVLSQNLGDMASSMYGNAYSQDQNNRLQAIGMAPQFGDMAYKDASQLMNAGQTLYDQDQQNLDFAYQQFQNKENDPYKKLAAMSGVFGSNLGGASKTTSSGGGK